jgi:hypothetical protein
MITTPGILVGTTLALECDTAAPTGGTTEIAVLTMERRLIAVLKIVFGKPASYVANSPSNRIAFTAVNCIK